MPETIVGSLREIATVIGVIAGVGSLAFAAVNTRATLRANRARFWLDLRGHFAKHDDVHRRLRPGGEWSKGGGPESARDWAELEAYMGLFEHCELMLDQKLIDHETFKSIYAYRLENIVSNENVRKHKLRAEFNMWTRFLALLKRMDITIPS